MGWTYEQSDPALMLFTAAMERFRMTFPSGSRVLELGCAESDWLERMHAMDPSLDLVGVDARAQAPRSVDVRVGNAMDPNLFPPESFDRIVLLGALEHFGLGFYGDPVDSYGDLATMANVSQWLRPGGFVYFDVPCQPTFRVSENRHFRSYSPRDIRDRLLGDGMWPPTRRDQIPPQLQEINRAYSLPEPWAGTWCHEPTEERVPYWFVAVLAQKV